MISHSLLTKVIVQTFEEKVGKWQSKNRTHKALKLTFSLSLDYNKEEGYRQLEVVIYGPMNYVGVYIRETWTVIALEDLEDDGEGDTFVKPGKDYNEGHSEWTTLAYHDSGWRTDGIDEIFRKYEKRITGFNGPSFYEVIDVPLEIALA